MSDELAFSSKSDLWLLILVLAAPIVCLWVAAENWDSIARGSWWLGILLAAGIGLPLWIVATLRYFLSDDRLRIRCGPFTWNVPIGEITNVEPTNNPLSSPAMSLDRVRISWGEGRSVMIAPEPREEFLRQLEHRRKQTAA